MAIFIFLYFHVRLNKLEHCECFKTMQNISYRVIYSDFLKSLRSFYLGSNNSSVRRDYLA